MHYQNEYNSFINWFTYNFGQAISNEKPNIPEIKV